MNIGSGEESTLYLQAPIKSNIRFPHRRNKSDANCLSSANKLIPGSPCANHQDR